MGGLVCFELDCQDQDLTGPFILGLSMVTIALKCLGVKNSASHIRVEMQG